MPKERTGTVWYDEARGRYCVRLTLNDGSRTPPIALTPTAKSKLAEQRAHEVAAEKSRIARENDHKAEDYGVKRRPKRQAAPPPAASSGQETCGTYFERWSEAREKQGLRSVRNDRGRWAKWLAPRLDSRPMLAVETRELEAIVQELDDRVRAGKLAWRTALHVWGIVTKMFDDATRAKRLDLRVLTNNPAKNVRGPDRGHEKAGAFLFPSELVQLAGFKFVPQWRRRIYVFATYVGLRAGEIRALEWTDVHEEQGFIAVHKGIDYDTGEAKPTKTGKTRRVPIEPALLPLLKAMRDEEGKGEVFARMPDKSELAWMLREDLKVAGIQRPELFDDSDTTRKLDFHDLRHTYGTWRAIRGDDVVKIRFAMGHSDLTTTQRYINEAHTFERGFGEVFGPLPTDVVNRLEGPFESPDGPQVVEITASPGGFEPPLAT